MTDFDSPKATHYIIYDRPKDYPDHFVVREFDIFPNLVVPGRCRLAYSLEQARNLVPPGLALVQPDPSDDPVIVEIWL